MNDRPITPGTAEIRRIIDPVMTPFGFLAGQAGFTGDRWSGTWCGDPASVEAELPHLIDWDDERRRHGGRIGCLDLGCDGTATAIDDAQLEGHEIPGFAPSGSGVLRDDLVALATALSAWFDSVRPR